MSKRESGVHMGREQKEKWSGVYVGAKVKREKKSVGHVENGERALETIAQATVSLGILSPFSTFSISQLRILLYITTSIQRE